MVLFFEAYCTPSVHILYVSAPYFLVSYYLAITTISHFPWKLFIPPYKAVFIKLLYPDSHFQTHLLNLSHSFTSRHAGLEHIFQKFLPSTSTFPHHKIKSCKMNSFDVFPWAYKLLKVWYLKNIISFTPSYFFMRAKRAKFFFAT